MNIGSSWLAMSGFSSEENYEIENYYKTQSPSFTVILSFSLENVLVCVWSLLDSEDIVDGVRGVSERQGGVAGQIVRQRARTGALVSSDLLHFLSRFVPNYPEMSTS